MLSRSRIIIFTIFASLFLALTACGGEASKPASPAPSAAAPAPAAPAAAQPAAKETEGPRKIQDALGTVELKAPAKRVVALEWTYAEDVLAVGVQPVGVADIENYRKWVKTKVDLASSVQDVGTRQEPNLEKIMALKPDLIIATKFRHEKILSQLKGIAPTLIFDSYSEKAMADQYKEMEETFLAISDALGKKEDGQKVLKELNDTYVKAAEKLKAGNKAGSSYVLTQAFSAQNAASFRLFTNNSVPAGIMTKLGFKNAWESEKLEMYGFSTVSVESLPKVQNASLLTIIQPDDNIIDKHMKDNPVWKGLTFVKENRIFALGGDTWPFGGPLSAETFVNRVVATLAK